MQEDGGWISVDGCDGDSPDGTFAVKETAQEIVERVQGAMATVKTNVRW
jgi:hypothetical protein